MIKTETEYHRALEAIQRDRQQAESQREALRAAGLTPEQVETAMEPVLSFHAQLEEEVAWYERVRQQDFPVVSRLTDMGRLLIALRIARGMTQRELATRLGVAEAVVSRDEGNEYHNITLRRAQRIIDAIGMAVRVEADPSRTADPLEIEEIAGAFSDEEAQPLAA